jgi:hypothetical protein
LSFSCKSSKQLPSKAVQLLQATCCLPASGQSECANHFAESRGMEASEVLRNAQTHCRASQFPLTRRRIAKTCTDCGLLRIPDSIVGDGWSGAGALASMSTQHTEPVPSPVALDAQRMPFNFLITMLT